MTPNIPLQFFDNCNISYTLNEPMAPHTSFKIGGAADCFLQPETPEKLQALLSLAERENIPALVLGKGSNLLVSDKGIEGMVISTSKLNKIELLEDNCIYAEAGASLTAVCLFAKEKGLSGLEFAYGIPGSVGGALYMNAGAYGGEMSQVVLSAESVGSNGLVSRCVEDLDLSYRNSIFHKNKEVITSVTIKLIPKEKEKISADMELYMSKRRASQPLDYPSAGSTFKRPTGYYAAALIDECGLKGLTVGGARVSEKHAGFVINGGEATCQDVCDLIALIKEKVMEAKGVTLETEVIFTGRR